MIKNTKKKLFINNKNVLKKNEHGWILRGYNIVGIGNWMYLIVIKY